MEENETRPVCATGNVLNPLEFRSFLDRSYSAANQSRTRKVKSTRKHATDIPSGRGIFN
jgi:hypothetical protein